VLRAVSASLEDSLERVNPQTAYLRDSEPTPATVASVAPLQGYGDLAVLINPAVEASAYQRLNVLSRSIAYPPSQAPILFTVSADNDHARHRLFRWGRIAGEWFTSKPHKADPNEREMERQALGVYGEDFKTGSQVTHRLEATDPAVKLDAHPVSGEEGKTCPAGPCTCDWLDWTNAPTVTAADTASWDPKIPWTVQFNDPHLHLADFDFALTPTTFVNVTLSPRAGAIAYQPMIVATTASNVIDDHSGIFTTPFVDFLVRYVSLIEAKQFSKSATAQGRMASRVED